MGIAGVLVGIVIVLTFVGMRADAPAETTQRAVVTPASPAPAIESTPLPTWTGARRARLASDGSKMIAFELAATRDVPVWMARARPVLVVRCLYRTTEAFVVLDTSPSIEEDADRRTVRVQWDDGPLSTERWDVSESGLELIAPDGIGFVRQMTHARQLRFEFTPFNARTVTAEFAVLGFERLAGMIATTCGWRLDERAARAKNP